MIPESIGGGVRRGVEIVVAHWVASILSAVIAGPAALATGFGAIVLFPILFIVFFMIFVMLGNVILGRA